MVLIWEVVPEGFHHLEDSYRCLKCLTCRSVKHSGNLLAHDGRNLAVYEMQIYVFNFIMSNSNSGHYLCNSGGRWPSLYV